MLGDGVSSRGHATSACRVSRYVGRYIGLYVSRSVDTSVGRYVGRYVGWFVTNISEFRAFFALQLLPNCPRLSCCPALLVGRLVGGWLVGL